jgi:hypothetical protein
VVDDRPDLHPFQQVEAAEGFLGLQERPVGSDNRATRTLSKGRRTRCQLELFATNDPLAGRRSECGMSGVRTRS